MTSHKLTRKGDKMHLLGTAAGVFVIAGAFILRWHEGTQLADGTLYKIVAVGALLMSPHIVVDKIRQMLSKGGK